MSGWIWVAIAAAIIVVALIAVFGTAQWRKSRPDRRHPDAEAATRDAYRED